MPSPNATKGPAPNLTDAEPKLTALPGSIPSSDSLTAAPRQLPEFHGDLDLDDWPRRVVASSSLGSSDLNTLERYFREVDERERRLRLDLAEADGDRRLLEDELDTRGRSYG
jgi:hypothetical protein